MRIVENPKQRLQRIFFILFFSDDDNYYFHHYHLFISPIHKAVRDVSLKP